MTKPKSKQPPKNFFRYFVDEYILFRRDFVIETEASVVECAKTILALSEENRPDFKRRRMRASYTTVTGLSTTVYFKVFAEQLNRNAYVESAVAEGTIEADDGTTYIAGKVQMFVRDFVAFIFTVPIAFLFFMGWANDKGIELLGIELGLGLAVFIPMVVYLWIRMYYDRNYLINQIQQAIHNAEMESNLSKTKNEPITQPYDDSSEYQSKM